MTLVTEAIGNFLRANRNEHNADLVERWSPAMETQLNVLTAKGVPVEGKENVYCCTCPQGFTCDYWHIRIPKNADSEPVWRDYVLDWPPEEFAEGIGSTGWDWRNRVSRWVGFDFDAITGHAKGVGLSDAQLEEIKRLARELPYVEVRKSTSGNGLHLCVHVEPISTENHTVHAQLARCILVKMGQDCHFDFMRQGDRKLVDACGGNMWLWHRKMNVENEELKLLKPAERELAEADLPSDWQDRNMSTRSVQRLENGNAVSKAVLRAAHRYIAACDGVPEGGRNQTAFRIAGHLAAFEDSQTGSRLSEYQIIEIMRSWNSLNDPPLDEAEFVQTVTNGVNNGTPREPKFVNNDDCQDGWLNDRGGTADSHDELPVESRPARVGHHSRAGDKYVPFPVHTLPTPVSDYVQAASESIGCDPAYVALPLLACLGQTISSKRVIQLKPDWCEPSVIWGAIIGESGTHKSPALRLGTEMLRDRQLKKIESDNERMDEFEYAKKRLKIDLKIWEKQAEQAAKDGTPPPPMPREPEEPVCARYFTTDATVEAIVLLLSRQSGGLLMLRDELSGWLRGMGEYKKGSKGGSDLGHWLSFWNADSVQKDRAGSKPLTVRQAAVSIVGGIQPQILKQAIGHEHRQDGLCQRFLLVMPPERRVQWTERSVDLSVRRELEELFDRLLGIETPVEASRIPLSPSAKDVFVAYYNRHRAAMAAIDNDLRSAWSKLEAYTGRLALIFEAVKDGTEIAADTLQAAIELSDWFCGEVRRVYAMFGVPQDDDLADLVVQITKLGGRATIGKLQEASRKYRGPGVALAAFERLASGGFGTWNGEEFRLGA